MTRYWSAMTFALLLTLGLIGAAIVLSVVRRGQAAQRAQSIEAAARRAVEDRLRRNDPDSRA
jgi:hypothetical protein